MFGSKKGELIREIDSAIVHVEDVLKHIRQLGESLEQKSGDSEWIAGLGKLLKENKDNTSTALEIYVLTKLKKIKYFDQRLRALIENLHKEFNRDFKD